MKNPLKNKHIIDLEKISLNHKYDKGYISRIYIKNSQKSIALQRKKKKLNNPTRKLAKGMKRHLTEEVIQMANEHMKRCLTSLTIKKM